MSTYESLLSYCKEHSTTLVAVSKTKPNESIAELYAQGQRIFGENRVQELVEKQESLPEDIEWHMIGHLQTNKVKALLPAVDMIHSVDRISLIKEINKEAKKRDYYIDILLQIKIAEEDTKAGWEESALFGMLERGKFKAYENVNIRGVMGMATFTDDEAQVRAEFKTLKKVFNKLQFEYFKKKEDFDIISMGMSGDYKIAIEQGANMIRVGSLLFGER